MAENEEHLAVDPELQREQELNLIGFREVRKLLALLPPIDVNNLEKEEEIGRAVLDSALSDYFIANEKHFLDPDARKYIIAGATMAYAYWHSQIDFDNGEQVNE